MSRYREISPAEMTPAQKPVMTRSFPASAAGSAGRSSS